MAIGTTRAPASGIWVMTHLGAQPATGPIGVARVGCRRGSLREIREAVHRRARERFAGTQHGGGKVGPIRRVGEVLGLEADSVALAIGAALAADEPTVELVAGVELHSGLAGLDLEHASRGRIDQARGAVQRRT